LALAWKVVWITGASSGIGLEIAKQLAAAGVKTALSSRHAPSILPPENTHFFALDVTDVKAAEQCANDIEKQLGPIDLCIFGAGLYEPFSPEEFSIQKFSQLNATNYVGVLNCINAVLPHMRKRGAGRISWIASVAGYRGLPKAAYYGPTKAALINLAECLKLEFAPLGLSISIVNPGFVATPMTSVNDFNMPFLMKAEDAASTTIAGLAKGKFEVAYPFAFTILLKIMRLLPYSLYFYAVAKLNKRR
jgi:short-subunit dehydrogenase